MSEPIRLGSATVDVAAAGAVKPAIALSAKARRLLRHHRRARLIVRTSYTSPTGTLLPTTSREVKPRHRPS